MHHWNSRVLIQEMSDYSTYIVSVPGVAEAEVRYTEVVLATVLLDAHGVPRHQADVLREAAQALHTSTAGIL